MTFAKVALAFLQGAQTDAAGELATALAVAVLQHAAELPAEWSRLALDVRDGAPNWAGKAVTLAGLVVSEAMSEPDQTKVGGGRR